MGQARVSEHWEMGAMGMSKMEERGRTREFTVCERGWL